MEGLKFLRRKGLITEGCNKLVISGDFGKVELTELLKEYKMEILRLPEVRVRVFPNDTDETFDGTIIEEKPNFYVVRPDDNLELKQNWNKKICKIINESVVEKKCYKTKDLCKYDCNGLCKESC